MQRKDNQKMTDKLSDINRQIRSEMLMSGLDTITCETAIKLTVETILERNRVYLKYVRYNEEHPECDLNPYENSLVLWNTQTRDCLCMLNLTPRLVKGLSEDTCDDNDILFI